MDDSLKTDAFAKEQKELVELFQRLRCVEDLDLAWLMKETVCLRNEYEEYEVTLLTQNQLNASLNELVEFLELQREHKLDAARSLVQSFTENISDAEEEVKSLEKLRSDWKASLEQQDDRVEKNRVVVEQMKTERFRKLNEAQVALSKIREYHENRIAEYKSQIAAAIGKTELHAEAFNDAKNQLQDENDHEMEEMTQERDWLLDNPAPKLQLKQQTEIEQLEAEAEQELRELEEELASQKINLAHYEKLEKQLDRSLAGEPVTPVKKTTLGKGKSPTSTMVVSVGPPNKRPKKMAEAVQKRKLATKK